MAMTQIPNDISAIPKFKVVVVGDGGVGKSALTIQYFQHMFLEDHNPTIEDSYLQNVEVDGEWCVLDAHLSLFLRLRAVLDTAGQDEFSAMREQYMRKGHGFIIVYSVTDQQSFRQVRRFYTQILRARDRDSYPMILAANKIDLVQQRVVTPEEGQTLAQELGVQYIETSAKNPPVNVDLIFHDLIRIIRGVTTQKKASVITPPLPPLLLPVVRFIAPCVPTELAATMSTTA
ncbi:Ras-related protein M-Ras [Echinococcus granulosus]|uniref:Ras-related protein M-Ras n=1 Tax=Echinococcus granulosus TaxID=6210 RepID=W6UP09_ECHGR|nr:Ras-related protein M-Ras [Echinococcus granulosus]EUB62953.1 Ras-related protein M-Ras [Echinococcus granulosus]